MTRPGLGLLLGIAASLGPALAGPAVAPGKERLLPVTLVTDRAFREVPNWRGVARGAVTRATEDLPLEAGLLFGVAGEETWEPGDLDRGLDAVLAEVLAAFPPGEGILAVFLGAPPGGLPGMERGYAYLGRPGFLVFAEPRAEAELGRDLRDQLAMVVRHELGHVFGIPHLSGPTVMSPRPEGRAWSFGELGIEILRANRNFIFESEVPFAGCALDTLRDVYLFLDERGEMEPALFADLAWAYRARGDVSTAESLFAAALRRDRKSRAARLGLAQCAVARRDTARALELAAELEAAPLPPRAQADLGALFLELRRFARAESLLADAVSHEAIPEGWFNLGLARLRLADREGAAIAFRRYLELDPEGRRRREVLEFLERTGDP